MRFGTNVYFQTETAGAYDAQTGDYAESSVSEIEKAANVSDAGIAIIQIVYGGIREGVKTVRIQGDVPPFDHIRIGSKIYDVGRIVHAQGLTAFVAAEVNGVEHHEADSNGN